MKISVYAAPALFEQTSTTKNDDSVTVVVSVTSDKEGTQAVATVRVVFTADEWKSLTPKITTQKIASEEKP